jgi:hypothetical protein
MWGFGSVLGSRIISGCPDVARFFYEVVGVESGGILY